MWCWRLSDQPSDVGRFGGGVATSVLYAAANPQRVPALVLVNGYARVMREPDYPHGLDEASRQDIRDVMSQPGVAEHSSIDWRRAGWTTRVRRWWARSQRLGASPGSVVAQFRVLEGIDVRGVLPSIQAPTLVVAREENTWIRPVHGRFLADHIPGAVYVDTPGRDYFPFIGDSEAVLSAIEQFVLSTADVTQDTDRVLATLLFTDIVGSTSKAAQLGDRAWADSWRGITISCECASRTREEESSTLRETACSPCSMVRRARFAAPCNKGRPSSAQPRDPGRRAHRRGRARGPSVRGVAVATAAG